jgi:hypothetical protein
MTYLEISVVEKKSLLPAKPPQATMMIDAVATTHSRRQKQQYNIAKAIRLKKKKMQQKAGNSALGVRVFEWTMKLLRQDAAEQIQNAHRW